MPIPDIRIARVVPARPARRHVVQPRLRFGERHNAGGAGVQSTCGQEPNSIHPFAGHADTIGHAYIAERRAEGRVQAVSLTPVTCPGNAYRQ